MVDHDRMVLFYSLLALDFLQHAARNARIASAVLATAIPSVRLSVCLSVRPRGDSFYQV